MSRNFIQIIKSFCWLVTITLTLNSCTRKSSDQNTDQMLNLAIWGNFIEPKIVQDFTKKTGIKVNITNYSSNEELLAKVQMGNSGIDVAVPSEYMVTIMIKMKLLEKINHQKIMNFKAIDPRLLKPLGDQNNDFSLPYCMTTSGIAIHRDLYKGKIKSWKDVFNNPELKGKISLLDDAREATGVITKMLGYSVNTIDTKQIQEAKDFFIKVKPQIKMFASDTIDILKNKEVAVAQAYSSDALQAAQSANIEYLIPEHGSVYTIDNLVILKNSKNIEAAHLFINAMYTQAADQSRVELVKCGPILPTTRDLLPIELKKNSALFPEKSILDQLEKIMDLEKYNNTYEDLWSSLKTI